MSALIACSGSRMARLEIGARRALAAPQLAPRAARTSRAAAHVCRSVDASVAAAVTQQALAYAVVLGAEGAFSYANVPEGDKGRPSVPLVGAGIAGTAVVRRPRPRPRPLGGWRRLGSCSPCPATATGDPAAAPHPRPLHPPPQATALVSLGGDSPVGGAGLVLGVLTAAAMLVVNVQRVLGLQYTDGDWPGAGAGGGAWCVLAGAQRHGPGSQGPRGLRGCGPSRARAQASGGYRGVTAAARPWQLLQRTPQVASLASQACVPVPLAQSAPAPQRDPRPHPSTDAPR